MQSTILPSADNAGPPAPETTTGDTPSAAAPSVKSRRVTIIVLPLLWFGNYPVSSPTATRGVGLWHEAARSECPLFRRSQGLSRHNADVAKATFVTQRCRRRFTEHARHLQTTSSAYAWQ